MPWKRPLHPGIHRHRASTFQVGVFQDLKLCRAALKWKFSQMIHRCRLLQNPGCAMQWREVAHFACQTLTTDPEPSTVSWDRSRQFLFRRNDIGRSKAEVAANFINNRIPGVNVTPHFCKIQDKDEDFYRQFHVVVCGLDSVPARRWMNGMLHSLIEYDDDNTPITGTNIPLVDGGTEGLKGNARVILTGTSACIECTLGLYPPQVTYPLCTIANTPRLPEHCIEYVKIIQWPKENPYQCEIDGDDPAHLCWIHEKSVERASHFGITGVDYKLVQGVVKNIIPAVASTNASIAAVCANEVFKLATGVCKPLNDYVVLNQSDGVYTFAFANEKRVSEASRGS
ncbi:Hypothetical predicted protein [Cloeon dipterum]|uniref:NEDD8-activating enzyme E1 catalytic subunit n=1 Tax=Cloeon dipterum TaxID=197152 RepID=A0A8S1DFH0_9INSE|nr:Hypothetical predicted protein [Cloeon dipterum]